LYLNGNLIGQFSSALGTVAFAAQTYEATLRPGKNIIAVKGTNVSNIAGLLAEIQIGERRLVTNKNWKTSKIGDSGWTTANYNDSKWLHAVEYGKNGEVNWGGQQLGVIDFPAVTDARWIWTSNNKFTGAKVWSTDSRFSRGDDSDNVIYFRYSFDAPVIGK